jgi:hypothetical protein
MTIPRGSAFFVLDPRKRCHLETVYSSIAHEMTVFPANTYYKHVCGRSGDLAICAFDAHRSRRASSV